MPELKTIRDRLANWAWWARGGSAKSQHSMTGFICDRIRTAAIGELYTSTGGAGRLDSADAALVERAWKALPPKHRELLRWHYIRGASPGFICRRMGIKPRPTSVVRPFRARVRARGGNDGVGGRHGARARVEG